MNDKLKNLSTPLKRVGQRQLCVGKCVAGGMEGDVQKLCYSNLTN